MNQIIYKQRNLANMPIISLIKVPSLEINSQGKEIIRAKKLIVHPPQTKSRSLSAHSNFRSVFKIPKHKKDDSKENSFISNNNSNENIAQDKERKMYFSSKKPKDFMEIHFLSEICHKMAKEHVFLKNKLEEQEKVLKSYSVNKNSLVKSIVPRINLSGYKVSPLRGPVKHEEKNEELMTFRPELTPAKKQFRFPREIFSKKLK